MKDIDTEEIRQLFSNYNQEIINEFIKIYYFGHDNYSSLNIHTILYLSKDWKNGNIPILWINSLEEFWEKWNKYKVILTFK